MRSRIGVLASGEGTNLQALFEYLDRLGAARSGDVVLVASNRGAAGALPRARERGVATALLAPAGGDAALDALLREHAVDLVVLAGYVRLVPAAVTRRYRGRMVNIHPALLPSFGGPGLYGERVHRAALAAGVRVSGATVHFVDEIYDHGAIIAQWPVPVFPGDTPDALGARVRRVEHALYPRVIDAVAGGRVRLDDDGRAAGAFAGGAADAAFVLSREETSLADEIEQSLAR